MPRAKVFYESLLALVFDLGGLAAGSLLAWRSAMIAKMPWLAVMYPMILGVRGSLNGVLSGRLSTGLHLGLVKPSFRRNTGHYHALVLAAIVLALMAGLFVGILVLAVSLALGYCTASGALALIVTALGAMSFATLMTVPITSAVAFASFRRGLDPDIVLYPVMSTVADFLATFALIVTASVAVTIPGVIILALIIASASLVCVELRRAEHGEFVATLKEASLAVAVTLLIEKLSGIALSRMERSGHAPPSLLMIYPVMIDTLGDIGSIFGTRTTTRLLLGELKPRLSAFAEQLGDLVQVEAAALLMHAIYALIVAIRGPLRASAVVFLAHAVSMPAAILLSFSVALATFRRGLNPGNFVNPFVSACSDAMMSVALMAASALLL